MTIHQTIKKLSPWEDVPVPYAGEIVIEQGTNKIKIGDGKTNFANLPYVDDNPTEMTLSEQAKKMIEAHIELIENNEFNRLFDMCYTKLKREICYALIKAGCYEELVKYCYPVPNEIADILFPLRSEEKHDSNATIKNRNWANINYPNRGKTQYQRITTAPNSGKYWDEYIIGYDVEKEVENIKKEIDYLQTWNLEDDE